MKRVIVALLSLAIFVVCAGIAFGGNVDSADIVDGAVITSKIADSAVTTVKIADGAVTSAKINSAGLDADTLDGIDSTGFAAAQHTHQEFASKPENVLVVAKSGGDYTSIQQAIDASTPTADDPVLIEIKPGVYTENIIMKSYVHLKGSGPDNTIIQALVTSSDVIYCNNARYYSINNLGITGGTSAIRAESSSSYGVYEGNRLYSNSKFGISIYLSNSVDAIDNEIYSNGLGGIAYSSISSGDIVGNHVHNNTGTGISTNTSNSYTIIKDNWVYNNSNDGIQVADNSRVVKNTVYSNNRYGIYQSTGSYYPYMVVYNNVTNNNTSDFYISSDLRSYCNFNFNIYNTIDGPGTVSGSFNANTSGGPAPNL
jgi:hypothetical protein